MAAFLRQLTLIDNKGGARTIYKAKSGKRKKVSRLLSPVESGHFRLLKAGNIFADELLGRYKKSRTKPRDGWLRHFPRDFMNASRKASKKLEIF